MKKTTFIFFAACLVLTACMDRKGSPKGEPAPAAHTADTPAGKPGMALLQGGQYWSTVNFDSILVTVEPFYLDKYEVTIRQFARFVEETGYEPQTDKYNYPSFVLGECNSSIQKTANWRCNEYGEPRDSSKYKDYPVVFVSFADAEAYAAWAGKRLPTIYEWEYAVIEGLKGPRPHEAILYQSWHSGNSGGIKPIGLKKPNNHGIYDLTGNVGEIVSTLGITFNHLPEGVKEEDVRRASFSSFISDPEDLYPPVFSIIHRQLTSCSIGFRCACDYIQQ